MSFITYAQNFEDVMLWRALKHIEKGFYIDIGAQEPIVDSVSMAFYEHGWRGVHIEPTQQYSDKLRSARPDEIVLQVAIANDAKSLVFFEFENTGLSTADSENAQTHIDSGFAYVQTVVKAISLDELLEQFANREIHWLKLDVEGLEKSVLESWVTSKVRPWILVIESTKPLTQEQTHAEWEALILHKQYKFVYFDGLNRFYLSTAHAEITSAFLTPPNFFDDFQLSDKSPYCQLVEAKVLQAETLAHFSETEALKAETRAQHAEIKAQQAETKAQQAETKAQQAETKAQQAETERYVLYSSTSWRVTAPLRMVGNIKKRLFRLPKIIKFQIKEKVKLLLTHSKLYIYRRPKFRYIAFAMIKPFPALKRGLKQTYLNALSEQVVHPQVEIELVNLSPRARQIYVNIKTHIKRRQNEIS